jgi:hypothetical protein
MKTGHLLTFTIFLFIGFSCSSGKKAYEKGDYYDAVSKAVARLKQKPDHKKSKETLRNAYPLALQQLEQRAENIQASNEPFKSRNVIGVYKRINSLAEIVKSSPSALKVIPRPKTYYDEIGKLKIKAAEELYNAGIQAMLKGNRHDSRQAYVYFQECETFVPKYKEALEMMTQSEKDGTLNVMYEESVYSYWTTSANIVKSLDQIQFIDLTHKNVAVGEMDKRKFDLNMLVSIMDYNEGTPKVTKKEQEIVDSVKIGEKVVNNVKVPTYQKVRAKYITYEKVVTSTGKISVTIHDKKTGNIVFSQEFQGSGRWSGNWASYSGDNRALSKTQKQACEKGEPKHDLNTLKNMAKDEIEKSAYNSLASFLRDY